MPTTLNAVPELLIMMMRAARDSNLDALTEAMESVSSGELPGILSEVVHPDTERGFPWELTGNGSIATLKGSLWVQAGPHSAMRAAQG